MIGQAWRVLRRDGVSGTLRAAKRRAAQRLRLFQHLSKRDLVHGRRVLRVDGSVMEIPHDQAWAFPDGTYYERNVEHWIRRALNAVPDPVFYDVGANYGYYSLIAAPLAGAVYAFDPVSTTYTVLQRNIERNGLANLETLKLAIGSKPETRRMTLYSSSGNNSLVLPAETWEHIETLGFEDVPVETLDGLVADERTRPPDLIKIDTEGGELDVLRGASRTLELHRPLVILEHSETIAAAAGYTLDSIHDEFEPQGYTLLGLSDPFIDPHDLTLHALERGTPATVGTVVAVPPKEVWRSTFGLS